MDPDRYSAERISARDVVANRLLSVTVWCAGCNSSRGLNVWKVGARLADTPLQQLKFKCTRCGGRATELQVSRNNVGTSSTILTIPLKRPVAGYGTGLYFDP